MKRRLSWLWVLPLHQLLSTVGILILAGFLTFAITSAQRARWILTETHFFPVQIGLALLAGFLLRRVARHPALEWVWVLPLIWLTVGFVITPVSTGNPIDIAHFGSGSVPISTHLDYYFGSACKPEMHCFFQLGFVLPLYTGVAYSFGAFLSRRFSMARSTGGRR